MKPSDIGFGRFFLRLTACHTVTYMVVGLAAFVTMDYATTFSAECSIMKPTDTPIVALGPALQVFRGLLFAVVLYPFRRGLPGREPGLAQAVRACSWGWPSSEHRDPPPVHSREWSS